MVTDTEDRNLYNKDSVIPPLIYLEDYNDNDSSSKPPSVETTPEPGPPREKPTEEPTLEPNYDALSEPSVPTREGSMGHISPKEIMR